VNCERKVATGGAEVGEDLVATHKTADAATLFHES
jgi:hypothetical protein